MPTSCLRCELDKKIQARGLCNACYLFVYRTAGELAKYPVKKRRTWDFAEDYEFAKATHGGTDAAIASRLGLTEGALKYRLHLRRKWGQM